MKMRLLLALAGLAIGFAVPALAEEQNAVEPEVRQQIEALVAKQDEDSTSATPLVAQPTTRRTQ